MMLIIVLVSVGVVSTTLVVTVHIVQSELKHLID
jgi:hypothetical protein